MNRSMNVLRPGWMALAALVLGTALGAAAEPKAAPIADPAWLRRDLEQVRAKYKLPALAAALVVDGKVVAASAVGHRKLGDPHRVTRDDRFQIGSVSKPMTATLIGALVEAGKLHFNDTLEKMFPELVGKMNPAYRKVTIRQLLSHTSGLPGRPSKLGPRQANADPEKAIADRYQYVCNALVDPPAAKPGTRSVYSGAAIIAVSYAERKLKKPYEDLMEQYVFRKLGMTTAGKFKMATPPDKLDGPWPHVQKGGRIVAQPPRKDRGMSRAPVGSVCCSVIDLGKWAAAHLKGERGHSNLLKAATFRELHATVRPPGQSTMSFGRNRPGWSRGVVLAHNGCDGSCYALVHIAPAEDVAICTVTNYGGPEAAKASNGELHQLLVKRVLALKAGKLSVAGRRR
jgi:CubicO group peptidase (beta-lactamase class C family)